MKLKRFRGLHSDLDNGVYHVFVYAPKTHETLVILDIEGENVTVHKGKVKQK